MNKRSNLMLQGACLFAFVITMIVLIASVINSRQGDMPHWEFALGWVMRGAGYFVATVSALALLLRGIAGASLEEISGLALPLLAGVVLIQPDWPGIVSLALIALGVLVKETFRIAREPANGR